MYIHDTMLAIAQTCHFYSPRFSAGRTFKINSCLTVHEHLPEMFSFYSVHLNGLIFARKLFYDSYQKIS